MGIAVTCDGPDPHGHALLASGIGGRTQSRHTEVVGAWRQVFTEAGGMVPDRNMERMLSRTNIPIPPHDQRRLDMVVTCLQVERGLPLFCDATVVSPITAIGAPRGGTSNAGGRLLDRAEAVNNNTYPEVIDSGLGSLQCLGVETYGRWGRQAVQLVPKLAHERTRRLHPRIQRGVALGLLHRWWGILGIAVQKAVARSVHDPYGDLPRTPLEPPCVFAELEVI